MVLSRKCNVLITFTVTVSSVRYVRGEAIHSVDQSGLSLLLDFESCQMPHNVEKKMNVKNQIIMTSIHSFRAGRRNMALAKTTKALFINMIYCIHTILFLTA